IYTYIFTFIIVIFNRPHDGLRTCPTSRPVTAATGLPPNSSLPLTPPNWMKRAKLSYLITVETPGWIIMIELFLFVHRCPKTSPVRDT
uniref:Uncharacterized protein n=2 Tax=Oreochromis TaxID=8139 RepID=A0A669C182_ORENI